MTRSYPTDEESRATFTDDAYEAACAKIRANTDRSTVVVVKLTEAHLDAGITPDVAHVFADLCREIPGTAIRSVYDGLAIVRGKSVEEIRDDVLSDRKSEMWYSKDSPYYIRRDEDA